MNMKYIIAIMFIAAALLFAGCTNPLEEIPPGGIVAETPAEGYLPPFAEEGKNATTEEFAANLLSAQNVYLVEDLRNLSAYPISKNNIMQCTVDYAGSPGLVGKTVSVFAFDDGDVCQTSDGPTSMADCYAIIQQGAEDPNTAIIWIEKGETPEFYSRGLLVRLSDVYVHGLCLIDFAGPATASPAITEEPNPETAIPEAHEIPEIEEEPVPVIPPIEEPAELNATEVNEPGDSHTFP